MRNLTTQTTVLSLDTVTIVMQLVTKNQMHLTMIIAVTIVMQEVIKNQMHLTMIIVVTIVMKEVTETQMHHTMTDTVLITVDNLQLLTATLMEALNQLAFTPSQFMMMQSQSMISMMKSNQCMTTT